MKELAEQAAARALKLQQVGENLPPTFDREKHLQEVSVLQGELEKNQCPAQPGTRTLAKRSRRSCEG
jgi:hypothetical protein